MSYPKEMEMSQASAWGMARRRPLEYQRKVDAAIMVCVDAVPTCCDACSPCMYVCMYVSMKSQAYNYETYHRSSNMKAILASASSWLDRRKDLNNSCGFICFQVILVCFREVYLLVVQQFLDDDFLSLLREQVNQQFLV